MECRLWFHILVQEPTCHLEYHSTIQGLFILRRNVDIRLLCHPLDYCFN